MSEHATRSASDTGPMTRAELDAFLREPWIAKLACRRPDGWPCITSIGYGWLAGRL
jgi:hypothetical protein